MADKTIASLIVPEVWNEYGAPKVYANNAFIQSGIAAEANITIPDGGYTINMPFFGELTGDAENLSIGTPLTLSRIGSGKETAVITNRGRGFTVADLETAFSGADPLGAVMNLLSGYWTKQDQKELMAVVYGVFDSASMADHVVDISTLTGDAAVFSPNAFIDAVYRLGDNADSLTTVVMHSSVRAFLAKQNLIATVVPSDGSSSIQTYLGKRVITDDAFTAVEGVYKTYIFANRSIAMAQQALAGRDLEIDRDITTKETALTMARRQIIHPVGFRWTGSEVPTRTQLATGTNWERVVDHKLVGMVAIKHKLA